MFVVHDLSRKRGLNEGGDRVVGKARPSLAIKAVLVVAFARCGRALDSTSRGLGCGISW